jgi:hypothetical protein
VQPYVDADVIRAYHDILNSDRFNDFQGWLHFQLLSPVVITHIDRVRGIVSDETQQHWAKCREEFAAYSDQLKLPEGQLQEKFRGHIKDFVTPNDFALCYGLDVLRRGWQYLERVTHAEGIYFAHPWRQVALSRSRSWKVTTEINGLSYSWGHYIDSLLQSDERYRTMPKVLGFVNALREAIDAEPSARWIHLKLTDASPLRSWSAAQKRLFRDEVYDAMEQIQRIAKRAKLPLRKKKAGKDNDDLFVVFLEAGIQALDNKVIDVFLLSFRFARIVAKKALPEKLYNQLEDKTLLVENQGRRAIDTFFQTVCRHGVYEYSGALPTIETT